MKDSLEQLRTDLMYLAKRQKALEDSICEWSEFLTSEVLKQGIRIHKHQRSDGYFKYSLSERHKEYYEKFEDVFDKIGKLYKKIKPYYKEYTL